MVQSESRGVVALASESAAVAAHRTRRSRGAATPLGSATADRRWRRRYRPEAGRVTPGLLSGGSRRFALHAGREPLSTQAEGGPRAACCLGAPRLALPSFSGLTAAEAGSSDLETEFLPISAGLEDPILQATQECSCGAEALARLAWFVAPVASAWLPIADQALLAACASSSWQPASQAPVTSVAIVSAKALTTTSCEWDRRGTERFVNLRVRWQGCPAYGVPDSPRVCSEPGSRTRTGPKG